MIAENKWPKGLKNYFHDLRTRHDSGFLQADSGKSLKLRTYQQVNASINMARITKSWIEEQNVQLLKRPQYSPDLNSDDNVLGWMTRKLCEEGRQFDNESIIKVIKNE